MPGSSAGPSAVRGGSQEAGLQVSWDLTAPDLPQAVSLSHSPTEMCSVLPSGWGPLRLPLRVEF